MIDIISPLIKQFLPFAQERMGFSEPPRLFLRGDDQNAQNPLGKTAYYDFEQKSITIYITGRHPKDVMRSISHELVHHAQCCRGDLDGHTAAGPGYAQSDDHMREMEREAYEVGNMCFRDWEDSLKNTIYLEHLQKGDKKMSMKDWKNKELTTLISEAWGFKFNNLEEFNEFNGEGELQAESEEEITEEAEEEVVEEGEEDLEEQSRTDRPDRARREGGRRLDEEEEEEEKPKKKSKWGKYGTIDPETDTPERKKQRAADQDTFGAGNVREDTTLTKEEIEALVKRVLKEALKNKKG
jgi:hypothetical protein